VKGNVEQVVAGLDRARVVAAEADAVTSLRVQLDEALVAVLSDESWGATFRLRVRAVVGAVGRAVAQSRADLVTVDAFLTFDPGAHALLHLAARRWACHLLLELHAVTRLP
jgi:hypothetical protein